MLPRSHVPDAAGLKPPNPLEPEAKPYRLYGPISQAARSPVEIWNSSVRASKPAATLRFDPPRSAG